jgi:hypothetical protein
MKKRILFTFAVLIILSGLIFFKKDYKNPKQVLAQTTMPTNTWYMSGANPQRTSWVSEQVPATNTGVTSLTLHPQWYAPIEGYIPHKIQIVAGNNTVFVSSANGVYAFAADTGVLKWVFPTELPIGHSPTYFETSFPNHPKRLYIPGMDHKLYCIDADPVISSLPTDTATGQKVNNQKCWTNGDFEAGAGFETNPLVANVSGQVKVFAGNRDSKEYAVNDNGDTWSLAWTYQATAPILFSTAMSKDQTKVYFASLDNGTYGVNVLNGILAWPSVKYMQGAGFYSYWPVVFDDPNSSNEYVVFNGSNQYRPGVDPSIGSLHQTHVVLDEAGMFGSATPADLTPVGPRGSDGMLDLSKDYTGATSSLGIIPYLTANPQRRTVFVLNGSNGVEFTNPYPPFVWQGTQSGNRFPALISGATGLSNFIFSSDVFYYRYIVHGGVGGWKFGTQFMSTPETAFYHAADEPEYYASGGKLLYWAMHQNVAAGVVDLSLSFSTPDSQKSSNWWVDNQTCPGGSAWPCLHALITNYDSAEGGFNFGGTNGNYGRNGDGNPPIPYAGKVYFQEGNALIAFGTVDHGVISSPVQTAKIVKVTNSYPQVSLVDLKLKLSTEMQKMITAGILRPGFVNHGLLDYPYASIECGDNLQDYFSNPSETLAVLGRAMPYLDSATQVQVKTYLNTQYSTFNPTTCCSFPNPPWGSVNSSHIGYSAIQAQRDYYATNPELITSFSSFLPWGGFEGWSGVNPPYTAYGLWQYALSQNYSSSQASTLLSKVSLSSSPPSTAVSHEPYVLNAYIAGWQGKCGLEKIVNSSTSCTSATQNTLNSLMSQRAANFTKDVMWKSASGNYCEAFTPSKNFIYLTKELGDYLNGGGTNATCASNSTCQKVQTALNEYYHNTPYWFQEGFEDSVGEWIFTPYYDTNIFLAKAYILKESREDLVKYLDVPMFKAGDLFYIQNLIAAIEAPSNGSTPTATPIPVCGPKGDVDCSGHVNAIDLSRLILKFGQSGSMPEDIDGSGQVNAIDLAILLGNFGQ